MTLQRPLDKKKGQTSHERKKDAYWQRFADTARNAKRQLPRHAFFSFGEGKLNKRTPLTSSLFLFLMLLPMAAGGATDDTYLKGNFTGKEMLNYCKVANDDSVRDFERGVCTGFIDGFAAGHHAAELWHAFHHRDENIDDIYGHLCVPNDVNRTALVAAFVRYLESHPDNLNWSAGLLLEAALREAYPCKKQK